MLSCFPMKFRTACKKEAWTHVRRTCLSPRKTALDLDTALEYGAAPNAHTRRTTLRACYSSAAVAVVPTDVAGSFSVRPLYAGRPKGSVQTRYGTTGPQELKGWRKISTAAAIGRKAPRAHK